MKRYTEQINGKWVITAESDNTLVASGDGNKLKSVSGASIDRFADFENKIERGQWAQKVTATTKNFTEKDKILALKYKNAGYLFVVRDRDGSILICRDLPEKRHYGMFEFWIVWEAKRIGKSHFKPVRFTDKIAITLDSLTEGKQ